jgi:PIN domain nuclease of toxin-antitoxin system
MSTLIADTHAVIWYLLKSSKLSSAAHNAMKFAVQAGEPISVASISLIEMIYLVEKNQIPANALQILLNGFNSSSNFTFKLVPLDLNIIQAVQKIPRNIVPELPDRVIAATALHLNLPLVTSDHKIQATNLNVIC